MDGFCGCIVKALRLFKAWLLCDPSPFEITGGESVMSAFTKS